jgi:hypothetical protein
MSRASEPCDQIEEVLIELMASVRLHEDLSFAIRTSIGRGEKGEPPSQGERAKTIDYVRPQKMAPSASNIYTQKPMTSANNHPKDPTPP